MAKNLIPEIAHMLGVEIGEEFEIEGYKGLIYQFTDDELIVRIENDTESVYTTANMTLVCLLRGKREIVKLPWKPKEGQTVYGFYARGISSVLEVISFVWVGSVVSHQALAKAGWVFKTRKEAEAALPKVAKEMGVEYEL